MGELSAPDIASLGRAARDAEGLLRHNREWLHRCTVSQGDHWPRPALAREREKSNLTSFSRLTFYGCIIHVSFIRRVHLPRLHSVEHIQIKSLRSRAVTSNIRVETRVVCISGGRLITMRAGLRVEAAAKRHTCICDHYSIKLVGRPALPPRW